MTPTRRGAYEIPSWAIARVNASAHLGRLHLLEWSQPREGGVWRYFCTLKDCGYYTDSTTPDDGSARARAELTAAPLSEVARLGERDSEGALAASPPPPR